MKERCCELNNRQIKDTSKMKTAIFHERITSLFGMVKDKVSAYVIIAGFLIFWQIMSSVGIIPKFMLPSPVEVLKAFADDFPLLLSNTIGLLDGFKSVDKDTLNLMRTMGATPFQNFIHVKLPSSIGYFFAGLRISVSYSIIGAVVAEWLGGFKGLGVYMTRVRKSFSYDKMFAVIFLVSFISLVLMYLVKKLQEKMMPWDNKNKI